jgi:eukaryotic-like serine/threonine-protein kinase
MQAIPGYVIDRKLSSGGTSGVYRALDLETGHHIALKILFPKWAKDPRALELLEREAWLLKSLNHPNVVKGVASGHWRGLHWVAMEWVAGPTALERVHRGGPLSPNAVLEMGRQLGEAVGYLGRRGIVHGDIKPANVLLAPGGVAKLCDFGFARVHRAGVPDDEAVFGTVAYAAPEQMDGEPGVDSRADLYGLGATLFHMATGRMPPIPDKYGAVPPMPDVVREVRLIVQRLMAPSLKERYGSAELLLGDLGHLRELRDIKKRPAPLTLRKPDEFHWEFN